MASPNWNDAACDMAGVSATTAPPAGVGRLVARPLTPAATVVSVSAPPPGPGSSEPSEAGFSSGRTAERVRGVPAAVTLQIPVEGPGSTRDMVALSA